uniref:Uncharacterized protein n=1 Tax=Lactuca sativa TaxID=4236 RepID=A0A9R1XST4_LACSA|nr:hypothetical protein LSAT_V11C100041320 [Lactuca sativa]
MTVLLSGEATCCGSVANPVNLALHHPHFKTKDVLQNPTHVQITNAPTISTMEMVVEHQNNCWLDRLVEHFSFSVIWVTQVLKMIIKKRDEYLNLYFVMKLISSLFTVD